VYSWARASEAGSPERLFELLNTALDEDALLTGLAEARREAKSHGFVPSRREVEEPGEGDDDGGE
jgi:hypothetical protein